MGVSTKLATTIMITTLNIGIRVLLVAWRSVFARRLVSIDILTPVV